MELNGETLLDILKSPNYFLLDKLGREHHVQTIIEQAAKQLPSKNPEQLSNAELLKLYKLQNTQLTKHLPRSLESPARNILDNYLIQEGLVDIRHDLAHLPRIQNTSDDMFVEEGVVETNDYAILTGLVRGIMQQPRGLQLLIDTRRPISVDQQNPVYVDKIVSYFPTRNYSNF